VRDNDRLAKNYPKVVVPPPGPKAKAIIERDREFLSPSYIKEYPLVVERGSGAMIEDVDGNRYLDFMAGIAVTSTGHSHPKVVAAIEETARKFLHICATDFHYPQFTQLAERLARLVPGPGKKRVFLTNSGTEAVEGAMKLARQHTKRQNFIAFEGAFHGRTYGSITLNASKVKYRRGFGPLLPGVYHLPYSNPYRQEVDWRAAAESLFHHRLARDEVAAVIMEPVQGEGGYVVPEPEFIRYWRDFCDANGALLVFDEIQSGIGRTGKMFAAEHFGVAPDVTLVAKGIASGMPIGAIVARDDVMTWERGSHGSTYGGNPVCCAAALATLDLVENGLMQNAARMGALVTDGLRELAADHDVIGDVRGLGLMIGVEFVKDRKTKEAFPEMIEPLELAAFKRGLLLLGAGRSSIRIAPPLVIDAEDVDHGLRILDESLAELKVRA